MYRNYRKPAPTRNLTQEDQEAWWEAIYQRFGVRLLHTSDIYAQRGRVYAGSEYVARLGATNDPELATEWTEGVVTLG